MPTRHRSTTLLLTGLVSALLFGAASAASKLILADMQAQVLRIPVADVKVLPRHPTSTDFVEYFNARKARNDITDATFCVRLCARV